MSPLRRILRALTNRSPRDIAVRASQIARAKLEYVGLGDRPNASAEALLAELRGRGINDPDALLARFRRRVESTSLPAFRDPQHTRTAINELWPDAAQWSVAHAQRVKDGRFDLLGFDGLDFGTPVDWSWDPVNELRAPSVHWTRVPYLDPSIVGDHKIVWELNRNQYFVRLGQAAWLTEDEEWTETWLTLLEAWMDANPPKIGINWTSSLEVGFRAISWLWALHFFARSPHLSGERFARIVAHLRAHGRHVEQYISTSFSPNTHLTGEALALVYLGVMLPELPEAERWRQQGREWLMGALDFQINADGGYFEQSLHYHQYTADFYIHLLLLSREFELEIPDELEDHLERIVDHLVGVTKADGTIPLIGDDDGGRLIFLDDRATDDVRSTILAAAVILGRSDWAALVDSPTVGLVWLLGPDALEQLEALRASAEADGSGPTRVSRSFPDTGLYVMRSGLPSAEDFTLVRCGPVAGLSGGHSHADSLAIDITMGGHRLLIDPGTGSYMDRDVRERFRSSAAHNTVTLDGRSSSESNDPFGWSKRAHGTPHEWLTFPRIDFFEGEHDGFDGIAPGLRHTRSVLYVRGEYWIVRDRIQGGGDFGAVRAHFQFAPGLSVHREGHDSIGVAHQGEQLATLTALTPSTWEDGVGAVAPIYGQFLPAPGVALRAEEGRTDDETVEIITLIARPGTQALPIASTQGPIWKLGDRGDLLAFGGECTELQTDFEWLWARPNPSRGLEALFAANGSRLMFRDSLPLVFAHPVHSLSVGKASGSGDDGPWLASGDPHGSAEATETLAAWLGSL